MCGQDEPAAVDAVPDWIREIGDDVLAACDKLLEAIRQAMFVLEPDSAERLCWCLHNVRDRVDALMHRGEEIVAPAASGLVQDLNDATEQIAALPEPSLFDLLRFAGISSEAQAGMKRLVDELQAAEDLSLTRFEQVDTIRSEALHRMARAMDGEAPGALDSDSSETASWRKTASHSPSAFNGRNRTQRTATPSDDVFREVLRPYDRLDSVREATGARFRNLSLARANAVSSMKRPWRDYVSAREDACRLQREFAARVLEWYKSIRTTLDDHCDDFILPSRDVLRDLHKALRVRWWDQSQEHVAQHRSVGEKYVFFFLLYVGRGFPFCSAIERTSETANSLLSFALLPRGPRNVARANRSSKTR